jgi:hypothetical protein
MSDFTPQFAYLGDAVYVKTTEHGDIELMLDHHLAEPICVMEPGVMRNLVRFINTKLPGTLQ